MPRLRFIFALLLLALSPLFADAQGPLAPPTSSAESLRTYQNSPDGLRWQLQDILNAVRDPDRSRLDSVVRQTKIPNSGEWFLRTFGQENGEPWARAYGDYLNENEKNFKEVLTQLAGQDGEFLTRIVNDEPAPARKIEGRMVKSLQRPVDIYFASWKERGPSQGSTSTAIGYFVFLEGRFRLNSAISSIELQPEPSKEDVARQDAMPERTRAEPKNPSAESIGNDVSRPGVGGVGYPKCTYCPTPEYTKEARAKHLEGVVVLQVIVQPNGMATDILVVKAIDPGLAQKAMEAVSRWRFNPARRADGEPVPVKVPIEISFRLLK